MSGGAWLTTQFDRFLALFHDQPVGVLAKPAHWRELVTVEDRGDPAFDWYRLDPDVVYPVVIAYLKDVLAGTETTPRAITMYITPARSLPADVWDVALVHLREHPDRRDERRQALELVRLVFTALLREETQRPIGLHILKDQDDRWRL